MAININVKHNQYQYISESASQVQTIHFLYFVNSDGSSGETKDGDWKITGTGWDYLIDQHSFSSQNGTFSGSSFYNLQFDGAASHIIGGNGSDRFTISGVSVDRLTIEGDYAGAVDYNQSVGGNDLIDASKSDFGIRAFGYGGNDTIIGSDNIDLLAGGYGNDKITSGGGGDTITGWLGDDTITIMGNEAYVTGDDDYDTIPDGKDTLRSFGSVDQRYGSNSGVAGIYVAGFEKIVLLGSARDCFGGASGEDITGNKQKNELNGGAGKDTLFGGQNKDVFVFDRGSGKDVVEDFHKSQDTIDISAWDNITGFKDMIKHHLKILKNDDVVIYNGQDQVTLQHVHKSDLSAGQFDY